MATLGVGKDFLEGDGVYPQNLWSAQQSPGKLSLTQLVHVLQHCPLFHEAALQTEVSSSQASVSVAALLDTLTGMCCWRHSQLWFRKVKREAVSQVSLRKRQKLDPGSLVHILHCSLDAPQETVRCLFEGAVRCLKTRRCCWQGWAGQGCQDCHGLLCPFQPEPASWGDLSILWLWGDHTVQTGICPTQHKFSA